MMLTAAGTTGDEGDWVDSFRGGTERGNCLRAIQEALDRRDSPLAAALRELAESAQGRGACLLVDHEEFGKILVAGEGWNSNQKEVLSGNWHPLVDLQQDRGLRRMAVMIEPAKDVVGLDEDGSKLAFAALSVTKALAHIASLADRMENGPGESVEGGSHGTGVRPSAFGSQ